MRQSLGETTRIIAVTAALAAGLGEAACSEASAHQRTPMAMLAHQIEAQKTKPGKTRNIASFTKNLRDNERASVTVGSPNVRNGRPNPDKPNYIDINITNRSRSLGRYAAPLLGILFTEESNGRWSAYNTMGTPTNANVTYHDDEIDQKFTQSYTAIVTKGQTVTTDFSKVESNIMANQLLHNLEGEARGLLYNVVRGNGVDK